MVGVTLFVGVVIANYGENKVSKRAPYEAKWLDEMSRTTSH